MLEMLNIKKLSKNAKTPEFKAVGDAGADLYNAYDYVIEPGEIIIVQTDIAIELPQNYHAVVTSRSSVSLSALTVHTGIIDSNYHDSIGVITENTSDKPIKVKKGERLAQILFYETNAPTFNVVENFDVEADTKKGFGSSGK